MLTYTSGPPMMVVSGSEGKRSTSAVEKGAKRRVTIDEGEEESLVSPLMLAAPGFGRKRCTSADGKDAKEKVIIAQGRKNIRLASKDDCFELCKEEVDVNRRKRCKREVRLFSLRLSFLPLLFISPYYC